MTAGSAALAVATDAELELFRTLLASEGGVELGRERQTFLLSRVQRRMRTTGARSLYDYYRRLTEPGRRTELQALLDDVQIHETSFFRNPAQFALLGESVLPERMSERLRGGRRVLRMWSAGCSTGQELDSLAMLVQESLVLPPTWDLTLLGTDISAHAVHESRQGHYSATQLEGLSPERRRRFFDRREAAHAVRSWVRRGVSVQRANVLDEPAANDFDVIFCRNVMIYFNRANQRRLLQRLASALAPGGYLFLGHTESPAGQTDAFQMVVAGRGLAYRKM